MTDEELIVDLNRLFWLLEEDRQYCSRTDTVKFAARRIEAQAAEIERLRGDLAKAMTGLNSIASNTCCDKCQEAALVARTTLAELTGAKT